jgi:hypothetical protein
MDIIVMHELRKAVDEKFVGFRPESGSVKPVHIAMGAFKAILGECFSADGIMRLSYVISASGIIPIGNEFESVKQMLDDSKAFDSSEISDRQLAEFRSLLQKLISVDNGVFPAKKKEMNKGMISYTAGSNFFVTPSGIHEDAGEFIGGLIKSYCPILSDYIDAILRNPNDAISLVFEPVLYQGETKPVADILKHQTLEVFEKPNASLRTFLESINESGVCLKNQLENHSNKLTQLRLFVLFCIYELIRYLSLLESFYDDGESRPILLDFTSGKKSSVSQTSGLCYSQLHKSISRFYAWGFAQEINRQWGYGRDDLIKAKVPVYDKPKKDKNGKDIMNARIYEELKSMWDIVKSNIKSMSDKNARLEVGMAINDMIAIEATSHPVNYMRKLGTEVGLLYPPTNFHTDKRFLLADDILESLLRCCVMPGEIITSQELRNRLYKRLGIVVGGTEEDAMRLKNIGSIVYADTDALANNFELFADVLQRMNFAEQLPDGIMQIRFGGNK